MNSTVNGTIASFITTRESNLVRCVFMAFSYSIIFVSLVANSLVIIAVKKDIGGHMQNSNNYFILNLSVADLILNIRLLLAVVIKTALNQRFLGSEWTIHRVIGQVLCIPIHLQHPLPRFCFLDLGNLHRQSMCNPSPTEDSYNEKSCSYNYDIGLDSAWCLYIV